MKGWQAKEVGGSWGRGEVAAKKCNQANKVATPLQQQMSDFYSFILFYFPSRSRVLDSVPVLNVPSAGELAGKCQKNLPSNSLAEKTPPLPLCQAK